MTESVAEILGLAAVIPGGVMLALFFVFYGQLIGHLRDAQRPRWIERGQPALWGGGSRGSLLRLMDWVSKRRYLMAQNVRTTTLGKRCRLVYFGMITVALWIAGIIVLGNVVFRR
jgi:hypothetical protein